MALCLCLLPQGLSAEAVADLSLAAARAGFKPAAARAWELACAGWFDGALAVVGEARRRTTDPAEIAKLDAMVVTYTLLKQRADAAANVTPPPPAAPPTAVNLLAAPSAGDGQVGRGCQYPTPVASSARDQQAPRAGNLNGKASSIAATPPPPQSAAPAAKRPGLFGWLGRRHAVDGTIETAEPGVGAAATAAPIVGEAPAAAAPADPPAAGPSPWPERLTWARPARSQPGLWEYSFGPALRRGGSVDFRSQTLHRPDGGQYVNGSHRDGGNFLIEGDLADPGSTNPSSASAHEHVSPQLDVVGWQTVDPNGIPNSGDETYFRNVTFDQSVLAETSADLDSSWAFSTQASRSVAKSPFLLYASRLTLGLGVFRSEASATASAGQGITTTTLTGILHRDGGALPSNTWPVTPYEEAGGTVRQGGPANYSMTDNLFQLGGARTTDVTVDLGAETYGSTLSLGLQYDLPVTDWFTLSADLGPALHLALAKTTLEQSAVWNAPASPLDGMAVPNFHDTQNDSALALCGGLYLALGAKAQVTRNLALELSLRYDEVLGTVETEQAEFDLSGIGAALRMVFSF
jgi:hypothetical protein